MGLNFLNHKRLVILLDILEMQLFNLRWLRHFEQYLDGLQGGAPYVSCSLVQPHPADVM